MQYNFRKLNPEESDLFLETLHLLNSSFGEATPDQSTENIAQLLSQNLHVFVALDQYKVIGALTAHVLPSYHKPPAELYVFDLAVNSKYRRQGIASNLFAKAEEFAHHQGIKSIYVQADYGDAAAVNFYNSMPKYRSTPVIHYSWDNSRKIETLDEK